MDYSHGSLTTGSSHSAWRLVP